MYKKPFSNENLSFNCKDDLIAYLQKCNPTMMFHFIKQYEAKNPNYKIEGFGKDVKIVKIHANINSKFF